MAAIPPVLVDNFLVLISFERALPYLDQAAPARETLEALTCDNHLVEGESRIGFMTIICVTSRA